MHKEALRHLELFYKSIVDENINLNTIPEEKSSTGLLIRNFFLAVGTLILIYGQVKLSAGEELPEVMILKSFEILLSMTILFLIDQIVKYFDKKSKLRADKEIYDLAYNLPIAVDPHTNHLVFRVLDESELIYINNLVAKAKHLPVSTSTVILTIRAEIIKELKAIRTPRNIAY